MSNLKIANIVDMESGRSLAVEDFAQTFEYKAGVKITSYNQMVKDADGELWRVSGQVNLPYVTTGSGLPEGNALVLAGDAVLRQDLADPDKGATMVAYSKQNVRERLGRVAYFEDVVSDTTGVVDVTDEMQHLLDSFDGNILSNPESVFLTTRSLFNRKHNRTVDFRGARIVNKSNSVYAIVTISPTFLGSTDAELREFMTQRHYGSEVRYSHVHNLRYEMSQSSGSGNNLGVGIVYGYKCALVGMYSLMTNGNGVEIRNSLKCGIYASEIQNHSAYGCFIFMSKSCEFINNTMKGGARGVCTKMNRDGDPYCDHIIAFNEFEDITSNGHAVIGGEWRETDVAHDIYVPKHEWVVGIKIHNNVFRNVNEGSHQTISMGVFTRDWEVYNNRFEWAGLGGAVFNLGGEGNNIVGERLGGGHRIFGNKIHNYSGVGNACILARLSLEAFDNEFHDCTALYYLRAEVDLAGNSIDHAVFSGNRFVGEGNGLVTNLYGDHGFSAHAGVKVFKFSNNTGKLLITNQSSYPEAFPVTSSADTTEILGGDMTFEAGLGIASLTGAYVLRGVVVGLGSRIVRFSGGADTVIALHLAASVSVQCVHEGNTYVLSGSPTTSRAVSTETDFVDGANTYSPNWGVKIFNTFPKPIGTLRTDRQASTIPTGGSWEVGDFVRNTSPVLSSGEVVFGWLRLTTGSGSVLGVDWAKITQKVT